MHTDSKETNKITQVMLTLLATISLVINTACTVSPDSIIKKPLTAKPEPRPKPLASSGSIYQAQSFKPLFEDRRPRNIGDLLTINITENTTAGKTGEGDSSRTSSMNATSTNLINVNLASQSKSSNQDNANSSSSNNFSGSISVTVIDVMENGNLVVSGEKQIAFDRGSEYVRFSGVINPDTVQLGNYISSTQVADAKIEYRTGTHLDAAQIASFLQRCFLSFIPL
jgi:flagellar L-ring protein precursor FlgH